MADQNRLQIFDFLNALTLDPQDQVRNSTVPQNQLPVRSTICFLLQEGLSSKIKGAILEQLCILLPQLANLKCHLAVPQGRSNKTSKL